MNAFGVTKMFRAALPAVLLLASAPLYAQVQSPTGPPAASGIETFGRRVLVQTTRPGAAEPMAEAPTVPPAPAPAPDKAPAVQSVKGSGVVTVQGAEGFQPILNYKVEYPELPDGGDVINYPATGTPLIDFFSFLSDASGWNIIISKGIEEQTITFWFQNVTPKQAMEILQFNGVYYTFNEDTKTLFVMTVEEYLSREFGTLKNEKFQIHNADVQDMEQTLTALLSPAGKLISDPRTGTVLVWDTKANLDEMREAVERLDVPLQAKAFALKHMPAESILDSVKDLLTERGSAQADSRTNTLIVSDLPSRQREIEALITALDQKLETRTWTLAYIDPKTVQERLAELIPEETGIVTADDATHQLSITAPPERLAEVATLIEDWDVKPAQVQIEAFLVTANTNVTRNLGIDWSYFDEISGTPIGILNGEGVRDPYSIPEEGQRISVGRLPYQVPLRNPLTSKPIIDANGDVVLDPEFKGNRTAVVIDYLNQQGELTILSKPRITVRDGMEASFENTEEIPYQNVAYSQYGGTVDNNNGATGFSPYVIPTTIQKEKVGTILRVLPRITNEGTISMEIEAEDSTAKIVTVVSGGRPSTVPQVRKSSAKTEVVVHNGQTIVLGGLRSGTVQDDEERVPVLGDVPLLGRLFKSTNRKREDRDLLVFLTPTVVGGFTEKDTERLTNIDAAVSKKLRDSLKPLMERIETRLNNSKYERNVAIGQTGKLAIDGEPVGFDEFREVFQAIPEPHKMTVIVRCHPNAPEGLFEQIEQIATEAGMKVVRDEDARPFVPTPTTQSADPELEESPLPESAP